jgi:predicted GNAT family N-acyltransferase
MDFYVEEIKEKTRLEEAFRIRQKVFVEEQKVPMEEELDEFEDISTHLLLHHGQKRRGVGTCRWRPTGKGVKLERFAILPEYRGKGLGHKLVQACLDSIQKAYPNKSPLLYLHAQISAVNLYADFGFKAKGNAFDECGIMHFLMEKD